MRAILTPSFSPPFPFGWVDEWFSFSFRDSLSHSNNAYLQLLIPLYYLPSLSYRHCLIFLNLFFMIRWATITARGQFLYTWLSLRIQFHLFPFIPYLSSLLSLSLFSSSNGSILFCSIWFLEPIEGRMNEWYNRKSRWIKNEELIDTSIECDDDSFRNKKE